MGRGGARPGSGRKPAAPGTKRERMSIYILPSAAEALRKQAAERSTTIGVYIEDLLSSRK